MPALFALPQSTALDEVTSPAATPDEKPRAVVRTRSRSLPFNEIAALYEQPGFPRP